MIELEKLYESARVRLSGEAQDWAGFAVDFKEIFQAKFVLYRPTYNDGILAWRSLDDLIVTTNPDLAGEYVKNRIFDSNQIQDDSLNPLEPNRRSDLIPDMVFRELDIVKSYFLPNGIFYMLAVSAFLTDNSHMVLVAWRAEIQDDFSELEMQRLSLFMRYLAVLVRGEERSDVPTSDSEIKEFGQRYALTNAEVDILFALLQGQSLRNIAEDSGRAYTTVRWHVQNILEKCHVKTQKNLLSEFYRLIRR